MSRERDGSRGRDSSSRSCFSTACRRATAAFSLRSTQVASIVCISRRSFAHAAALSLGGTGIFRPRQKHSALHSGQKTDCLGEVGRLTTCRQSKHTQVALLMMVEACGQLSISLRGISISQLDSLLAAFPNARCFARLATWGPPGSRLLAVYAGFRPRLPAADQRSRGLQAGQRARER
jgi:hypothetical protein